MPTNPHEEEMREILKSLLKRVQDWRDGYAAKEKALQAQVKETEACIWVLDQVLDEMRQELHLRGWLADA